MTKATGRVDMTEGPLLGILLKVAAPIALSMLFQSTYDVVNALWVGQLGQAAIAAVAVSGPLFGVLISLGSGLSTAGAVLIAQNAGAGRLHALDHVAAQTSLMVGMVSLAFALCGAASAPGVLRLIGVEPQIRSLALGYLDVRYLGMVPMFAFMAAQAMLQAVGEVRFAMMVQIGSVVLNAALDPLLIFGPGPLPALGVSGAAAATVIAQLAALAVISHHLLSGRSALHLRWPHFRPDWGHIRLATGLGLPASIEQAIRTFSSLLLMSLTASFGAPALAAYGVGTRLMFFWFVPMIGLSVATANVVGQNIGAGKTERAKAASRLAAWTGFVGLTAIGLILMPLARTIMTAFAPGEPEVIGKATTFAYVFCPFMGMMCVPQVLLGTFRGAGSTRQSMALSIIMQWLFQLPSAWLLALTTPLGLDGVWWSYPIANTAAAALCIGWFRFGPWRRRLVGEG